jgi:hypothetical protein
MKHGQQEMRNKAMEDHNNDNGCETESPENDKKQSTRQDDDDEIPAVFLFSLENGRTKSEMIGSLSLCKCPLGLVGPRSI